RPHLRIEARALLQLGARRGVVPLLHERPAGVEELRRDGGVGRVVGASDRREEERARGGAKGEGAVHWWSKSSALGAVGGARGAARVGRARRGGGVGTAVV